MQDIYQCTRCGTGWLAKRVEPRGLGWAVQVFVCSHCRYASQPGVRVSGENTGALLARVHTAIVPVAGLTGPGVEGLQMEELCMLLGLGPAVSGRQALDGLARAGDTWPGQRGDGATLRLVASVCARLWGRSPWGRASLRLREPSHFDTSCMVGSMLLCA